MECKVDHRGGSREGCGSIYFIIRFFQRQTDTSKVKGTSNNRGLVVERAVYHLGCIPQLCSIPPSAKKPLLAVQTAPAIKHLHHVIVWFPSLTWGRNHRVLVDQKVVN